MNALEQECGRLLQGNNRLGLRKAVGQLAHLRRPFIDRAFWPNAQLVYALSFNAENRGIIRRQAEFWKKAGFAIAKLDDVLMAYVLSYKTDVLTADEKAALRQSVLRAAEPYRGTVIPYRKTDENTVYIDALGMVPPFLCRLGAETRDAGMMAFGAEQFGKFLDHAVDRTTGLPYHAFNKKTGEKLGIIGWGRSLGWILTGLSECIASLAEADPDQAKTLLGFYETLLETSLRYQRPDGGFSWQLQAVEGPLDTSCTGMILQSLCVLEAAGRSDDRFAAAGQHMLECLKRCERGGKVLRSSAECGGIGIYPQRYGSYAWSVAPYLISLSVRQRKPEAVNP